MDLLKEWEQQVELAYAKAEKVIEEEEQALRQVLIALREIHDHRTRAVPPDVHGGQEQ